MIDATQIEPAQLGALNAEQLRELAARLIERAHRDAQQLLWRDARIDQLTFEIAQLKRQKFGARSERFGAEQKQLFDEAIEADIAAVEAQLEQLRASLPVQAESPKAQPKRTALPAHLPRVERRHEPENTTCACGCAMTRIGEDISEKLDYAPGVSPAPLAPGLTGAGGGAVENPAPTPINA